MIRIFQSKFRKSFLSMSRAELPDLIAEIKAIKEDTLDARILLTCVNSLRFKVNSPKYSIQELKSLAIEAISKRLAPSPVSDASPSASAPVSNASPSASVSEASASASAPIPKSSASSSQSKSVLKSEIQSRPNSGTFPHPLITGPLRHEATHVQELYYLPLAQLHNQLFILTQQAIKRATSIGWQGESPSSVSVPAAWKQCFAPNSERASLQQRIIKLDNQLQNFWKRYHIAVDQINGIEVTQETLDALDAETKKVDSPSLAVSKTKPLGSYTKKEIDSNLLPTDLGIEEIINARQERNKKILRRRDRQKSENHKATITEAATELHEWGIYIESSQAETCRYYGFDPPQDWLRPVPTDEERRTSHAAAQKKYSDNKNKLKREMREAFLQEARASFAPLNQ